MKRSRSIRLVLIGGLSGGALTCGGQADIGGAPVSADRVYTNDFQVRGVGYYHAPYRAWYQIPYNFFESKSGLYFHGGQWTASPHQSITNISSPSPQVASAAQAQRTDIRRGGFGHSSRSHWVSS